MRVGDRGQVHGLGFGRWALGFGLEVGGMGLRVEGGGVGFSWG